MTLYHAHDDESACALWLFTGATNSDEDYRLLCDSIRELDVRHAGERTAGIQIVEPGNPPPPSRWRREIAAASTNLASRPVFALVSTSPVIRGVLTAINWLRPPTFEFTTVATFEAAVIWCEKKRGESLPAFARLHDEVRAQARARDPGCRAG